MKRRVPSLSMLQKRVSDSVALGWGLRVCIANKFPGGADVADPEITP